jgi:hypothetical protein
MLETILNSILRVRQAYDAGRRNAFFESICLRGCLCFVASPSGRGSVRAEVVRKSVDGQDGTAEGTYSCSPERIFSVTESGGTQE